jgi:hypothetical protein
METFRTLLLASGLLFGLLACNTYPVDFQTESGAVEYRVDNEVSEGQPVDILWVIDNSGSMCQEQKVLRDNFEKFVERLRETNINFHIAVTTTHLAKGTPTARREPVARPGFIQSTAQPKPTTTNDACHRKRNEAGAPVEGDFQPVRNAIKVARDCAKNPSQIKPADEWTTEELRCAAKGECPDGMDITLDDIFPATSAYRDVPSVLKAEDYRRSDGTIDVDEVKKDFKCMSTVGTRGSGIEMGLKAAAKAVSPELTGGPVEAPIDTSAPNHGFIRQDSNFALIFVTDENDCSHPEQLSGLINQCFGDEACDFLNRPGGFKGEQLTAINDLADRLVENLSDSKKTELSLDSEKLLAASIHGRFDRFDPDNQQECTPQESQVGFSCSSNLGKAESGDRYDRFLRKFNNFFPAPPENSPDANLPGLMCRGSFASALSALGDAIPQTGGTCINEEQIIPCEGPGDNSCPTYQFTGNPGQCQALPSGEGHYCTSGIQIQIYPPTGTAPDQIEPSNNPDNSYCVPSSIDSQETPGGCVVKRSQYEFVPCPDSSDESGLTFEWKDPQYFNTLEGYRRVLRFTQIGGQDDSDPSGSADARTSETSR